MGLYAGDISARRAWEMLENEKGATLIDVRTIEEWQNVGQPDLNDLDKKTIFLSWRTNPGYELNPEFVQTLNSSLPNKDDKVFLLCKGGGRSREAAIALTAAGFSHAYNIENGFEAE